MKTKININRKELLLIGITFLIGISLGWVFFHNSGNEKIVHEHSELAEKESIWTCSMHPQIKQDKPGVCPICAMDLVPIATMGSNDDNISPDEIQLSESAIQLANIQTTIISKGIPEKSVSLLGKIKPDERNISELTSRFSGRIEKLFVNYTGQEVVKGQKLATIYSPDLITAQKELLEAIKFKDTNPTYYKAAVSKLKLWDLNDTQINNIIENSEPQLYFDVLSPITGTVTKRHVTLGDYVKEGTGLFEVIDLSNVWVMFDAYESDLPWVKKGDHIDFTVQSVPGKSFEGIVSYIAPFIDAKTRVAKVRVELTNFEKELKLEMFANGVLHSNKAEKTNELLIPKSSILWTGKRAVVYVRITRREVPTFIYREITLGPDAGMFYVVSDGLSEGEEIATNGVFKIDAAAQLAGKPSMMNPVGGNLSTGHNHGDMVANKDNKEISTNQNNKEEHKAHKIQANIEHSSFKVSGNCEMCKTTIEKAAKSLTGVNFANWDIETKQIHVSYNKDKVNLNNIHKTIAASGYDTEKETASQDVYDNLPGCCQYTRE